MDQFILKDSLKKPFSPYSLKASTSHLILLIFWPIFGLSFAILEQKEFNTSDWHLMHTAFDEMIPFNEYFIVPYLFWFVFLTGMVAYTALFNVAAFQRMMYFIMITYTVTIIIYIIYPTYQDLRPVTFERTNIFTQTVRNFYRHDTKTNVCPSLHVLGSVAAMLAGWDTERFSKTGWKIVFFIITVLISISTLTLKQHSIVDVILAIFLSIIAYIIVYIVCGHNGYQNKTVRSEKHHEKISA